MKISVRVIGIVICVAAVAFAALYLNAPLYYTDNALCVGWTHQIAFSGLPAPNGGELGQPIDAAANAACRQIAWIRLLECTLIALIGVAIAWLAFRLTRRRVTADA